MPAYQTTRRVRHAPQQMFDLVADIAQYPQFVPLCTGMRIKRHSTDSEGHEIVLAEMQVGYRAIRERFTTRVTLDRTHSKILVEYVDGPFRQLQNRWEFRPVADSDQASTIEFFITYEFASRTLGFLMGAMFDKAFRKFASAFEQRADQVYGRGGHDISTPR
jgi:coenzyme Q-binding protein COQ10